MDVTVWVAIIAGYYVWWVFFMVWRIKRRTFDTPEDRT